MFRIAETGALANLDHILTNDLQGNALKMGQVFFDRLGSLPERYPFVAEVRGRGLMVAVELCHPSTPDPWPEAAAELLEATRRRGLLIGKGGLYGNVLRIAPPLSLTEDEAAIIAMTVYHEARHGEQHFRIARLEAGEGKELDPSMDADAAERILRQ